MKIQYFQDTDTLYIQFRRATIAETRDLDEDTLLELDDAGNIAAITIASNTPRNARIFPSFHSNRSQPERNSRK